MSPRERAGLRRVVAPLSPRRRRWIRFLHSLELDPAQLDTPIAQPGLRDFIICGSPRTGTTLLSGALFQPPGVVTVMEPWDGMRMPPAELLTSLRAEIDTTGTLRRGRLDIDRLRTDGRPRWCQEGQQAPLIGAGNDYLLGVKWPAFWRYLELLPDTKFLVCLRHPLDAINSYKKAGGRVAQGLQYDTAFNKELNTSLAGATRDVALRRLLLFDHIHERILPHLQRPNVMSVRYERWFEDSSSLLADISEFLGRDVTNAPIQIHRPPAEPVLASEEVALIRSRCRTAQALGYRLDEWPSREWAGI